MIAAILSGSPALSEFDTQAPPGRNLASQDRIRDAARLVLDWIWETDPAFNFTYVSPHITDVLNLLPSHVQGTSLFALGRFKPPGEHHAPVRNPDDGAASQLCPDQNTDALLRRLFGSSQAGCAVVLMSGRDVRRLTGKFRDFAARRGHHRRYGDAPKWSRASVAGRSIEYFRGWRCAGRALSYTSTIQIRVFFAPIADALTLKTTFVKFSMSRNGWDCHGAPMRSTPAGACRPGRG
jgi:hypothetical protein